MEGANPFQIPIYVSSTLLPDPFLSVRNLLDIPTPPCPDPNRQFPVQEVVFQQKPSPLTEETFRVITSIPLPDPGSLTILHEQAVAVLHEGFISFSCPVRHGQGSSQEVTSLVLPLWVLDYWRHAGPVSAAKMRWKMAARFLQRRCEAFDSGCWDGAEEMLNDIPWGAQLPKVLGSELVPSLLDYFSRNWLSDGHIDQMLRVLTNDLATQDLSTHHFLHPVSVIKLLEAYRLAPDTYLERDNMVAIHSAGDALRNGDCTEIGMVVFMNLTNAIEKSAQLPVGGLGNHWTSLVISVSARTVYYGDSMGYNRPEELTKMIHWWMKFYIQDSDSFRWERLPCGDQEDVHSCGLLAFNAIAHHFLPGSYSLISPAPLESCDDGRINMVFRLVNLWKGSQKTVKFVSTPTPLADGTKQKPFQVTVPSTTSTFIPITKAETAAKAHTKPLKAAVKNQKKANKTGTGRGNILSFIGRKSVPVTSPKKKKNLAKKGEKEKDAKKQKITQSASHSTSRSDAIFDYILDKGAKGIATPEGLKGTKRAAEYMDSVEIAAHDSDNEEDVEVAEATVDTAFLVNMALPPRVTANGGKKRSKIMDRLVRPCHTITDTSTILWRCVGLNCGYTLSARQTERVTRHAKTCYKLPDELRALAGGQILKGSPSYQLSLAAASEEVEQPKKKRKSSGCGGGEDAEVEESETVGGLDVVSIVPDTRLVAKARITGRDKRQARVNLSATRFICGAGLPTYVASRPEWKDLFTCLDPFCTPPTRDALEYKFIPGEQQWVIERQLEILRREENLTISYDGGTKRGGVAFWTIHVSTSDGDVYFVEGREASEESHTALWISKIVMEVIDRIGRTRFCAAVCDSTGNTLGSRTRVHLEIPIILPLPDAPHHGNNLLKDISGITYFRKDLSVVRVTLRFFHHSHNGTFELGQARNRLKTGRGLEAIGRTRFSTLPLSTLSVKRTSPALKEIASTLSGFEELAEYYQPEDAMSEKTTQFEWGINRYLKVTLPAVQALTLLEANNARPDDVFIIWHASIYEIHTALTDKRSGFPLDVQREIVGIINFRYNEIFGDGRLSNPIYLVAAYLHPAYLNSDLFVDDVSSEDAKLDSPFSGIRHRKIFKAVGAFLAGMAQNEIVHGHKVAFKRWENNAAGFKEQYKFELTAYARRQYPYNRPIDTRNPDAIVRWWKQLIGTTEGQILPHLAAIVFAIRVNSMSEERTVSTFTWLTPALRNNLAVPQMVAMTQVRQHHQAERKRGISKPVVRWAELKKSLLEPQGEVDFNIDDDEMDDSWMDDPQENIPWSAEDMMVGSPLVNLNSSIITDVFSDHSSTAKSEAESNMNTDVPAVVGDGTSTDYAELGWE